MLRCMFISCRNSRCKSIPWWLCVKRSQSTKDESIKTFRNIGIIAHIDAGKTTTTERMLYYSGFTHAMGEVHDGDTVMDYMPEERERGITITSAAITFYWKKHKVNLIDTPGHIDFTVEVERSLFALDGGVIILDSSAGVEVQTVTVWNQAKRYGVPCIAYLNKMDKSSANFTMSVNSLKQKLKLTPLVLQVPIGEYKNFVGVVDLVLMRKLMWDNTGPNKNGRIFKSEAISRDEEFFALVSQKRNELIETVADLDNAFADKFILHEDSLSTDDLLSAIRRITLKRLAVPVLCGSSYKNIAVQTLMDAIVLYLPHPDERNNNPLQMNRNELCALVFKIIHDKRRGPLTFLRLFSGSLESGKKIYNVNRRSSEKIMNLLIPSADNFHEVPSVSYGNIVIATGIKEAITGDILVSNASSAASLTRAADSSLNKESFQTVLQVPDPVFFCTIEPPSVRSLNQLEHALSCLQREDPTFRVEHDEEIGQIIILGMGELHIEIMKERIHREYGIKPYLGPLQVAYRETVTSKISDTFVLSKSLGGNNHFVKLSMILYSSHGAGTLKEVKVVVTKDNDLGKVRTDHLKAINSGVKNALNHGPVIGFPVIDVKVNLLWLEIGKGTSLPMITSAASQCVQQILRNSQTLLLEPVMNLSISTAKGYAGSVLSDLSLKRSKIVDMEALEDIELIRARTPLSELKGYSTTLRALTSGTCALNMEFDCYEPMEHAQMAKAIEDVTGFAPSL